MAASVCSEMHRHQSQIELVCLGLNKNTRAKFNNHRGIKPLLDFLALLPQFDQESAFANDPESGPVSIGHHRWFTFLIHTDQFAPEINSSNVRKLCVGPNSSEAPIGEEAIAPSSLSLPADTKRLANYMGASRASA